MRIVHYLAAFLSCGSLLSTKSSAIRLNQEDDVPCLAEAYGTTDSETAAEFPGAIEAVAAGLTWVPWSDIGSYIGGAVRDKVSDKALEAIWEAGRNALNGDASSHPLDKEIQALCDA